MPNQFILINPNQKEIIFKNDDYSAYTKRHKLLKILFKSISKSKNEFQKLKKYQSIKNLDSTAKTLYSLKVELEDVTGLKKNVIFDIGLSCSVIANSTNYYTLETNLGSGTYGSVKKTNKLEKKSSSLNKQKKISHSQEEVIKIINHKQTDDEINKEITITKMFDPKCSLLGTHNNKRYCTQTYWPGIPLYKYLPYISTMWSTEEIIAGWLAIARALKKLHDEKIVHRDLHVGNVLIEQQNSIIIAHIIDYGLAIKDGATPNSASLFCSPEESHTLDKEGKFIYKKRTTKGEIPILSLLFLSFVCNNAIYTENFAEVDSNIQQKWDVKYYNIKPEKLSSILKFKNFLDINETTFNKIYVLFEGMLKENLNERFSIDAVIEHLENIQQYYKKNNTIPLKKSYQKICAKLLLLVKNLSSELSLKETTNDFINASILALKTTYIKLSQKTSLSLQDLTSLAERLHSLHVFMFKSNPVEKNISIINNIFKFENYFLRRLLNDFFPPLLTDEQMKLAVLRCKNPENLMGIFDQYYSVIEIHMRKAKIKNEITKKEQNRYTAEEIERKEQNRYATFLTQLEENKDNAAILFLKKIEVILTEAEMNFANKIPSGDKDMTSLIATPLAELKKTKEFIKKKLLISFFVNSVDITSVLEGLNKYIDALRNLSLFLEKKYPSYFLYNITAGVVSEILKCFSIIDDTKKDILQSTVNEALTFNKKVIINFPNILIFELFNYSDDQKKLIVSFKNFQKKIGGNFRVATLQGFIPSLNNPEKYIDLVYALQQFVENSPLKKNLISAIEKKITPELRISYAIHWLKTNAITIENMQNSKNQDQIKCFLNLFKEKINQPLSQLKLEDEWMPLFSKSTVVFQTAQTLKKLLQINDIPPPTWLYKLEKKAILVSEIKLEINSSINSLDSSPLIHKKTSKEIGNYINQLRDNFDLLKLKWDDSINVNIIIENLEELLINKKINTSTYVDTHRNLEEIKKILYKLRSALDIFGLFSAKISICLNVIKTIEEHINQESSTLDLKNTLMK